MRGARAGSIEHRIERLRELESKTDPDTLAEYQYRLDMSWIHHDNALEGIVYEPSELAAAISDRVVSDSSLIPGYDEIRQCKTAIDLVREMAAQPNLSVDLDTIKQIYLCLAPDEVEGKGPPKYRKEMPLHRLYFHEISAPDKISYKMRQLMQWLESEDTRRLSHPTRVASKTHYQLLQIFPYPKPSGKVARLVMNLMLMHEGYPPAILHATDRQRYYDALKTSPDAVATVVLEALDNSIESALRYFHRLHGIEESA